MLAHGTIESMRGKRRPFRCCRKKYRGACFTVYETATTKLPSVLSMRGLLYKRSEKVQTIFVVGGHRERSTPANQLRSPQNPGRLAHEHFSAIDRPPPRPFESLMWRPSICI